MDGGHQLRHDAALEPAVGEARLGVVGRQHGRDLAVDEDARDVAHEDDPLGAEPDGERRGRLVGVDVERAFGERRDHRHEPGVERLEHRGGRDGSGSPTRPSASTRAARSPISSPNSATAAGPIAAQTSALTAASDARTTSSTSGVVTRRPRTKAGAIPRRSISLLICGPAPCTTTVRRPASASADCDRGGGDAAAELQDDRHVVYSALSRT